MRSNSEIEANIRLSNIFATASGGRATVTLPSGFCGSVIWGRNEGGEEHVSVSSYRRHKLPTWDDMCQVKDIFFDAEEMAVQIHPPESEYVHSVGGKANPLENVLHLWRPVDGDWSCLNAKEDMGVELKPCPFCGNAFGEHSPDCFISLMTRLHAERSCGASISICDEQLIPSWNTRAEQPIVRCKDCRFYEKGDSGYWCMKSITLVPEPDGFCAWGKVKEGEW